MSLTKVVPFAKMAPQWSRFPEFSKKKKVENTFQKVEEIISTSRKCTLKTKKVCTNMVPFFKVELKWLLIQKWSRNQPFFGRKWYHFAKWHQYGTFFGSGTEMAPS